MIPVTVLTGFLGSGKTTLLNHLLQQPDLANTAVLINEFGEIGLDHHLVKAVEGDIVLLNSGCLCCSIRGDLVTALRDLYLRRVKGLVPEFSRLIIETTGLADPAPILHTLMTDPLASARYRLDGIVTLVDAANALDQLETQPEPAKQAAVADRLVLTKADLVPAAVLETVKQRVRLLNPAAPILVADHGQIAPEDILNAGLFSAEGKAPDVAGWLRAEAYQAEEHHHDHDHHHHHHDVNRHGAHITAYCLRYETPLDWDSFVQAIEPLIAAHGNDILRLKGLLNIAGQAGPVVVHAVQHVFHPPAPLPTWPDEDHSSRLVFITRNLGREVVEAALSGLRTPYTISR